MRNFFGCKSVSDFGWACHADPRIKLLPAVGRRPKCAPRSTHTFCAAFTIHISQTLDTLRNPANLADGMCISDTSKENLTRQSRQLGRMRPCVARRGNLHSVDFAAVPVRVWSLCSYWPSTAPPSPGSICIPQAAHRLCLCIVCNSALSGCPVALQ